MGAAAFTAGQSRMMASQSCGVRVRELPAPKLTPLVAAAPGNIIRLLAPMLATLLRIISDDPWPMLLMAIAAPTPIMMPSVVSTARITLRRRARSAIFSVRPKVMQHLQRRRRPARAAQRRDRSGRRECGWFVWRAERRRDRE